MMSAKDKKKGSQVPRLRFPEFRDAGEWEEKPLIAVADYENGKAYEPHIIEGGRYIVVNSRFISTDGAIKKYSNEPICIAKRGDILMVLSDLPNGRALAKSYYVDADNLYAVNQRVCRLTPHSANGKFLCFLLDRHPNLLVFDDGKNQTHLKKNSVLQCLLKLPLSFDEQQRIADCLSSLDERIAAETSKLDTLKDHKKGLLKQLFPAEGETTPELRFPEFRDAGEWKKITLYNICDILPGYTFPEVLQGKQYGQYPFCKVSDISKAISDDGGLLHRAINYVDSADLSILKAKPIPIGTTVFAKIGEALRLNRRAISTVECLIDNNAVGIKAKPGKSINYFLYILSQRIDLNEYCGGAVPSVSKTVLENIAVVISTCSEQQRIADCLSSLDELIAAQTQKINLLKDHKKGLMQQLFPVLNKAQV